jgi:hypothetical protein
MSYGCGISFQISFHQLTHTLLPAVDKGTPTPLTKGITNLLKTSKD